MLEEEKLRRDRETTEVRYQDDLEDKRRQFLLMQEDQLKRMQDYWERKHEEELRRWEEVMRMPRYMNYVDKDDPVRLTQAFVDQLGSVMRNELDKLKVDVNGQEVDLQAQLNRLKVSGSMSDVLERWI